MLVKGGCDGVWEEKAYICTVRGERTLLADFGRMTGEERVREGLTGCGVFVGLVCGDYDGGVEVDGGS